MLDGSGESFDAIKDQRPVPAAGGAVQHAGA
jgi:hypothetical protein